jgi:hypothetical protein
MVTVIRGCYYALSELPNEEIGQQSELNIFKEWYTLA